MRVIGAIVRHVLVMEKREIIKQLEYLLSLWMAWLRITADKAALLQFFKRLRQASIAFHFRLSHDFRTHQAVQMFSKTF